MSNLSKSALMTVVGAALIGLSSGSGSKNEGLKKKEYRPKKASSLRSFVKSKKKREEVTDLDLSFLELSELPEEILKFSNLRVLKLTKNHLSTLPDWLSSMKNLEQIWLGSNEFTDFPSVLKEVPKLHLVDISYNQISELRNPEDYKLLGLDTKKPIGFRKNSIGIGENPISRIPIDWYSGLGEYAKQILFSCGEVESYGLVTKQDIISLMNLPRSKYFPYFLERVAIKNFDYNDDLFYSSDGSLLEKLSKLEKDDLIRHLKTKCVIRFSDIHSYRYGVQSRRHPNFWDAKTEFPKEVYGLSNLDNLILLGENPPPNPGKRKGIHIPDDVWNLDKITKLHIQDFSTVSGIKNLAKLRNLKELTFKNCNNIEDYEFIFSLDNLVKLNFEDIDGITYIPKQILNLKNLESLTAQLNDMVEFPVSIFDMDKLVSVNFGEHIESRRGRTLSFPRELTRPSTAYLLSKIGRTSIPKNLIMKWIKNIPTSKRKNRIRTY